MFFPPWLFYALGVVVILRYPITSIRLEKLRLAFDKKDQRNRKFLKNVKSLQHKKFNGEIMSQTEVLIVSKGHAYNHDAFLAMFDGYADLNTTLVEQPAAQIILQPQNVDRYDAVLFYDMSGIPDVGLTHDESDSQGQPSDAYRSAIEALIESGKGIALLNHGTVSWPNWPLWREILGSSFLLRAGEYLENTYLDPDIEVVTDRIQILPSLSAQKMSLILSSRASRKGFSVSDEIY